MKSKGRTTCLAVSKDSSLLVKGGDVLQFFKRDEQEYFGLGDIHYSLVETVEPTTPARSISISPDSTMIVTTSPHSPILTVYILYIIFHLTSRYGITTALLLSVSPISSPINILSSPSLLLPGFLLLLLHYLHHYLFILQLFSSHSTFKAIFLSTRKVLPVDVSV